MTGGSDVVPIRRKCERCNTLNDERQAYCVNCGKYLRGKITPQDNKMTIWGLDESLVKNADDWNTAKEVSSCKEKKIVVCPDCSNKITVDNGVLPLSCPMCGYYFQDGVDKIINEFEWMNQKNIDNEGDAQLKYSDRVRTDALKKQGGPLKRAAGDKTSLRITSITSDMILPELMKEAGNIIGKNGTVFRRFTSDKQLSIWHTAAGWYARAIIGTPLFNGVPMNQGIQVKLSEGDLLVIDQEQFMVELF